MTNQSVRVDGKEIIEKVKYTKLIVLIVIFLLVVNYNSGFSSKSSKELAKICCK